MNERICRAWLLLSLSACAPPLTQIPSSPPDSLSEAAFALPPVLHEMLPNGIELLMHPTTRTPKVSITYSMRGGRDRDPAHRVGLHHALARLASVETERFDRTALMNRGAEIGGYHAVYANERSVSVYVTAFADCAPEAMEMLQELVLHPRLSESTLSSFRAEWQTALRGDEHDLEDMARRVGLHAHFGGAGAFAYRTYSDATIGGVSVDELRAAYQARLREPGARITVVGDFDPVAMRELFMRTFGHLQFGPATPSTLPSEQRSPSSVAVLPMQGATMVRLEWLYPSLPRQDDLHPAFAIGQFILGGSNASRLMMDLREHQSLTYGIGARDDDDLNAPTSRIDTTVTPANAPRAIDATRAHLRRMTEELVSDEELRIAKRALVNQVLTWFENPTTAISLRTTGLDRGLPEDYYEHFVARLQDVTAEQVRDAMRRALLGPSLLIAVGDTSTVQSAYGESVRVLRVEDSR